MILGSIISYFLISILFYTTHSLRQSILTALVLLSLFCWTAQVSLSYQRLDTYLWGLWSRNYSGAISIIMDWCITFWYCVLWKHESSRVKFISEYDSKLESRLNSRLNIFRLLYHTSFTRASWHHISRNNKKIHGFM